MYSHINSNNRILIVYLLKRSYSYRKMANEIGVNVLITSREVKRNWNYKEEKYIIIFTKKKSKERRKSSKIKFRKIESDFF